MKTYAWRRLTARVVDGALLCFPFLYGMIRAAEAIQRDSADTLAGSLILSALGTASALILEPVFISKWGFTPGKWLLDLRVLKKDGSHLSHREALIRTTHVITKALGLCVRGLVFLTLAYQGFRLWKDKESSWDADLESACLIAEDFGTVEVTSRAQATADAEGYVQEDSAEEEPFVAETMEIDEAEPLVAEAETGSVEDDSALEDPSIAAEADVGELVVAEADAEDEGLSLDLEEDEQRAA